MENFNREEMFDTYEVRTTKVIPDGYDFATLIAMTTIKVCALNGDDGKRMDALANLLNHRLNMLHSLATCPNISVRVIEQMCITYMGRVPPDIETGLTKSGA
jgi:hypothetical protein